MIDDPYYCKSAFGFEGIFIINRTGFTGLCLYHSRLPGDLLFNLCSKFDLKACAGAGKAILIIFIIT